MESKPTQEELKLIWSFTNDLWKFIKAYYRVSLLPETDDYWQSLVNAGGALGDKYNRHPLCVALIMAVVKYLNDHHKAEMVAAEKGA